MSIPNTQKQWNVQGKDGFESLKYSDNAPVPEVGEKDVLIKFEAVSLNYRDLIIPKGMYPFNVAENVVPASDGAGTVITVGPKVTQWQTGDKVTPIFTQGHLAGDLHSSTIGNGIGGGLDGCLRQYGAFDEQNVVRVPSNLSLLEASTLPCAAVTAWNALYGLESRSLKPGDWVLTQGTGGVSIFALQFAKAAGAKVVATTSSNDKAERLKQLGANVVINYKEDAEWGTSAKKQTTNGEGFTHIIEVGGPSTMRQSLNAVKMEGVITIIGFLGGAGAQEQPGTLEALTHVCTIRGILVGSRLQFEAMNRAIEANNIKPVVDQKVFSIEDTKDAYQYQWDQKHFGKLCIKID